MPFDPISKAMISFTAVLLLFSFTYPYVQDSANRDVCRPAQHDRPELLCSFFADRPTQADRQAQRDREQCQADCLPQDWTYASRWYGDSCTCHGSARKSD